MLSDCFERGQLRKVPPDLLKAKKSLETARLKLAESKGLFKAGFLDMGLVCAYAAMFHAGRALLYKDGVQEKSHYCLVVYLREKYAKADLIPVGLLTVMDGFRQARHDVMYGFESVSVKKNEQDLAIATGEKLLSLAEKLV